MSYLYTLNSKDNRATTILNEKSKQGGEQIETMVTKKVEKDS